MKFNDFGDFVIIIMMTMVMCGKKQIFGGVNVYYKSFRVRREGVLSI